MSARVAADQGPGQRPEVVLSLREAAFGYADHPVVRDVTLDLVAGEVLAVLGPNGSGKSTLVRGLLGLSEQLGGEVELFGVRRQDFRDHTRVGYVPQRHTLGTSVKATVEEIVAIGRVPHHPWWSPVGARSHRDLAIIAGALEVVGLPDRTAEDVATLSGGQQRRVLIARALAAQPDVLIMDEPTAGVDASNQRALAEVLRRLSAAGTTMVIVTHELDALADVVDRVAVIEGGGLAFLGTAAEYAASQAGVPQARVHHHDHEPEETRETPRSVPTGVQGVFDRQPRGGRRA